MNVPVQTEKALNYIAGSKNVYEIAATPENARRLNALFQTAVSTNPKVRACSPESILAAGIKCMALNLELGVMNQAWIIPRAGEACLDIGYGGLISLAKRAGDVAFVEAFTVKKNDKAEMVNGVFVHEFDPFCTKRGPSIGYYCNVHYKSGHKQTTTITLQDAMDAKKRGGSRGHSAWDTDPDAMGMKTAVKRGLKFVDMKPIDARVITDLDRQDFPSEVETQVEEVVQGEGESRTQVVERQIAKPKAKPKAEPAESREEQPPDREPEEMLFGD